METVILEFLKGSKNVELESNSHLRMVEDFISNPSQKCVTVFFVPQGRVAHVWCMTHINPPNDE